MYAKFVSLKASYPLIRRTCVSDLGRWIIYSERTKNSYRILKTTNTKEEQNHVYPWQDSQTISSSTPAQSVCAHLKHFAHRIHSSTLWSSEKRPVQNTQSASCSLSPSVESSEKGTAKSVSECHGESDIVGPRQTLLFRLFEGPRRTFEASRLVLDLVVCFIFFFWVAPTKFL